MIRLTPKIGRRPLSLESLRLLTEEVFQSVTIDQDEGESQKAVHLMTLGRIGARADLIGRRQGLDVALVTIEDPSYGEEGYVSFLFFPGEEIIIGFSGPTHEQQGGELAIRLAGELGYDVSHE